MANKKPTKMTPVDQSDPAAQSGNLIAENIRRLRYAFPEIFTEGRDGQSIDFELLKELLGDIPAVGGEEKYGLYWYGKHRARKIALTPSLGTLRPREEESVDWESADNIFIEGDNLESLKLLQKSYANKVKLIYIDPPYNGGKRAVYKDDFTDSIRNHLMSTGQSENGQKSSSTSEIGGRFHSTWLNMMYPRLLLARNLLSPLGAIFISIDDSERDNLRLLCNEVFGEENFVASIIWRKKSTPDSRSSIGSVHDYILCYLKDASRRRDSLGKMEMTEKRMGDYTNRDDDPRGPWTDVDLSGMTGRATEEQYFTITTPSGREITPAPGRAWGLAEKTFRELDADNRIWYGEDGNNSPRRKLFLNESEGQTAPSFWGADAVGSSEDAIGELATLFEFPGVHDDWAPDAVGSNEEATKEVLALFDRPGVFEGPKPTRLIRRIIQIATKPDRGDIVLDFFAGSGTTGHAVLQQNAEDGGDRRFLLIQVPEPLDPNIKGQRIPAELCKELGKPANLAEVTKERLRRAVDVVREEFPEAETNDGVAMFSVDTSNIRVWSATAETLEADLLSEQDHLVEGRTEEDLLYELLLKLGLDLCVEIQGYEEGNHLVYVVGDGRLIACLSERIDNSDVDKLGKAIAELHKSETSASESICVFRDAAFTNNVPKANMMAILQQAGLKNVRSV